MSTFVYAPGIKVYIDTYDYGILDVSEDLTKGGMQRRSDGVSQFQCGLNNVRRKYDNVFKPNDRIVVVMKRLTWLRTYTGYLNSVPLFSSWPREVQITSSCSIKRLQYFFWDPNLAASQNLVRQSLLAQPDGSAPDGGIKQVVINLLEEVVDWSGSKVRGDKTLAGSKVHIGAIPATWFDYAAKVAKSVADNQKEEAALAAELIAYIGGSATVAGQTVNPNGSVAVGTYGGLGLNQEQVNNAAAIISATLAAGHSTQDAEFAVGCALDESSLVNLDHGDRDSVGLFQQRPSEGWGTKAECMDVTHATTKFLERLSGISNRASLPFSVVIQTVQASATPTAYAKYEAPAKAIVAAYVQSTTGSKTNNGTLGSAIGVSNGTAGSSTALTPIQHGSTTGVHLVDVARQLSASGVPYQYGNDSRYDDPAPTHLDCSSFVNWVYYHALGDLNGMPRDASGIYEWAIAHGGQAITVDSAFKNPGSLVFVGSTPGSIEHIEFTVSPGRTIGTRRTGTNAGEIDYDPRHFSYACTLPKVSYPPGAAVPITGGAAANTANTTATLGAALATGATASKTDIVGGGKGSQLDNLFGPTPWTNAVDNPEATGLAQALIGIRSLQNDEAILPYITNLLNATMRQFCSAPNGDFIAWFPDYYGLWGTAAKMVLEPIEVKDFQVSWNDEYLITHQFVIPTNDGGQQLDLSTGQVAAASVLSQIVSTGIATVEQSGIMAALFGLDQTPDQTKRFTEDVLNRFGPRPDLVQVPGITGPKGEFFMALFLFMQSWTHQFTANIEITYMPELFPGMLIQLPLYNFQAYVVQVEHSFTLGQGGGFSTTINIAAPSRMHDTGGEDKLLGLPIAGTKIVNGKTKAGAPAKGGTAGGRSSKPPSKKASVADYRFAAANGIAVSPGIATAGAIQARHGRDML